MSSFQFSNPILDLYENLAQAHADYVERQIEQILNKHGLALDEPGVDLEQNIPPGSELRVIYTLRHNGVILDTFGVEMTI